MQIGELFERIDEVMANDWSENLKLAWLNEVERQIIDEVFATHAMSEEDARRAEDFTGYTEETPEDTVLLAVDPYSALYQYYLEAQIARANGDSSQQKDATTLFDNMYLTYKRYINRTCRPYSKASTFLI